ncbi:MAG: hypothetical protein ACM3IJ_04020 [Candidatus Levyibacteriota bacterium]
MAARPSITDEHYKRYNDILATPVKSNTPTPPAPAAPPAASTSDVPAAPAPTPQKSSMVSSLLNNIPPKAKGIGNKVFIFTGKKKIVLDGEEQEVEKIKTVTPEKQVVPPASLPPQEKITVNIAPPVPTPTAEISAPPPPPPPAQVPSINKAPIEELKKPVEVPKPPKPAEKKTEKTKIKVPKSSGPLMGILLTVAVVFLLVAWTIFWAVFFGLMKI